MTSLASLSRCTATDATLKRLYYKLKPHFLQVMGQCELCRVKIATDIHHTRGRLKWMLLDMRYWKAVCRECHAQITLNPEWARSRGFLCEKGFWNRP